ncbi:rcc01693 family protein [Allosediminivita pacifica]|uniref:Putative phage protein (TIGR02216 family) n=1 Tax=Allosediminivita pacifica TaxID=1267769 RepID=A0A2T6AVD4_9RHOB|nr:rcc01693 family protein [Allosediminivita pacifica]PTX47780.1 putative phage protein (TIGR02216 family) [Allosediminivita pacifica]GGB12870.1 phage tail assembly chaperone [Allosediminivita pacifica]
MSAFDWPGLLRAGLQELRIRPEQFWALTPAELSLMLGQPQGGGAMGRGALERMMAAYPDRTEDEG